jgi:soluble lytic murein transglycosylase
MKKFLSPNLVSLTAVLLSLFQGCATTPTKITAPPLAIRLEVLKKGLEKPSNESEEIASLYLKAMNFEKSGENQNACNLFSELSRNPSFPLADAALVHRLKNCNLGTAELENIWNSNKISTYLRESYFEISRDLAEKKDIPLYEAKFSFESIAFTKIQSEKVKLIKRAIALAQKLNNTELQTIYQNKLKEISPLHNTEINDKNIYIVAKDFESNRQFDRARELYKKIIAGEFLLPEKVKAYNAYRISYKVERNLKLFLEKTVEMEGFLKLQQEKNPTSDYKEAWAESVINLARAVWTEHRNADAKKILGDFLKTKLGSANQVATMHWLCGSLDLENKEQREALKQYEKASKIKVSDINLQENIQWAIVWNNYLLKMNESVIQYADKYVSKTNNPIFSSKLNFWKAQALLKLNKIEEAKIVLSSIVKVDPFGYYGILSTIDLQEPLKPFLKTEINHTPTGNHLLDWLIAMEEKTFSQKYLKEIDSQFKTPQERERAMSLYAQTEWYQGGMRQIYNFKASSRNAMTLKYINIVYPTPYMDLVSSIAKTYNVPPELVLGITRQESAFVPSERSWADAFGLMQMIPEKAKELSRKYAIPYDDFNDLYDPEINLEMGTALLKDLREKFKGKFAQTVAAYNASDEAIRIWERDRFNGNYLEFIEMIPYEETRNYIKLVFRNYITYKRITSNNEFLLDKDFFSRAF